jgi:polysaccharide chain length determinant protein (PEP-CTERM system associated)
MRELLQLIRTEVRGTWRFRWVAMLVAWVICISGWLYVYTLPNIYEARAQVFVDADSRLAEVMGEVGVAPGVGAAVFVVRQAMMGRPQLEAVAEQTGLAARAEAPDEYDNLIVHLQETISIAPGRFSEARNLYTISFKDRDRQMAISVVTALLDNFVENVLELNDQGSLEATGYLDDQLSYYGDLLSESEQRLAEFKKQNIGLLPGESGGIFERLQDEMDLLKQLRRDLGVETDRREALRSQLRAEKPNLPEGTVLPGSTEPPGSPTETAIRELESQRSSLLLTYTPRHPDVVAINEQLEQLYETRRRELASLEAQGDGIDGIEGVSNASNPVYQNVQIALNQSSVRIAGLRSEIAQHEEVLSELRDQINTIPDVEAKFSQLNRDYDQYRALYNQLLVQKERERMGEPGANREVVSFKITEPPSAALDPVAPPRTFFLLFVLLLGLGAGGGIAFLKHTNDPVFCDVNTLRKISGKPVLGAISMTWEDAYRASRHSSLVHFGAAGSLLILTFLVSVALQDDAVSALQELFKADSPAQVRR